MFSFSWVQIWSDQSPVRVWARNRDIHTAQGIHDPAEAVELDHGSVIDADAQVVLDRFLQQTGSAAGIVDRDAVLVGCVDALVLPAGDIHPQVARDGDEGNLAFVRAQDGDHHCVGTERAAGALVRADQQEVDRFLAVVKHLAPGGVDGRERLEGVDQHVRVDGGGLGLG